MHEKAFFRSWVRPIVLACVASVPVVVACVGDDPIGSGPGTGADGGADGSAIDGPGSGADAASGAAFTLSPARPRVLRGASVEVGVELDRKGVAGDVVVSLKDPPAGITATPATIPAAASTGKITFATAPSAPMGTTAITLSAPGFPDVATAIVVTGTPGQADESFDGDGFVIDPLNTLSYNAIVEQPDGKIVVAGSTGSTDLLIGTGVWVVKRFEADGKPDTAFNTEANKSLPTTGAARALAIDPATGKIVISGSSNSGGNLQLTLVRLNTNGAIDQGFASAGKMVVSSVGHPQGSSGNAVVVLADSTIVVAGRRDPFALVEKYTAGGLPAPGFATYNTTEAAELNGIAALPNGVLLAAGTDFFASPDGQIAVRLLATGALDPAFNGGMRTYPGCRGLSMALADNGDAVLVGDDQANPQICHTRFAASATGALLQTRNVPMGSTGRFFAAARASAGSATYAGGFYGGSVDRAAYVERRLPDGGLDPAFGTGGIVEFEDVANSPDTYRYVVRAAAPAANGQLLLSGTRLLATQGGFIARIWE